MISITSFIHSFNTNESMKTTFKFYSASAICIFLFITQGCRKEEPVELPVVSTTPATEVTVSTATSGGTITSDGGATVTANGVCWGVNSNPTTDGSKTVDGGSIGQYISNLTGLEGGTIYHIRAYATNSAGTAYGADMSFTTLGLAPIGLTQPVTNNSATGVTLNGTVNANYLSTTVTFEYGISTSYGQSVTANPSPVDGNSITNVSASISGLSAGVTYHYRIKTVNSLGTTYGDDMTFTTSGQAPIVVTQTTSSLSSTGVTLNGTVNPNSASTTVTFEYGLTASYGNSIAAIPGTLTGNNTSAVSAVVSGLTPGTTYHFRIKAVNSLGTVYGSDMSFMTSGEVPLATTVSASNVTTGSVILNGIINARNFPTTVTFEYGPTTSYGNVATAVQSPVSGNGDTNVNVSLNGLNPGSTYHFRVKAVNSVGTSYGTDMYFVTQGQQPTGVTQPATNISTTGATLNASVNPNFLPTTVTFEYGLTTSYGQLASATPSQLTGNVSSGTSSIITGLAPGTTYHFRVKAVNSLGTLNGNDLTFTTLGSAPYCLTQPATNISTNDAVLNATVNPNYFPTTITFEYGTSTSYGNTVNVTQSPLSGNSNTNVSATISDLTAGITYHFRVRAINILGTTYGNDRTFAYTISDVEGNSYRTVTIGSQIWMAENLKTTRYNDNSPIPIVADQSNWDALTTPAYCWYNNDRSTYGDLYGALYNWYTAATGKLCPIGWHVPNNAEWFVLIDYLGGLDVAGGKMKTVGLTHWLSPNTGATNESGFSALPGGHRADIFFQLGEHANFLSAEPIPDWVGAYAVHFNQVRADYGSGALNVGLSVRCVKNE